MSLPLVYQGIDQIQHLEQSPSSIMTSQCQKRHVQTLITVLLDRYQCAKIDQHQFDLQWTGCGSKSVPRSVVTLMAVLYVAERYLLVD